jgi:Winged helix DNA-binding domain
MTRFTVAERRARLAVRHHLATKARATAPADGANGVVALHATDPASVYLSLRARLSKPTVAEIERSLYEDKSLVRLLGMRRTMFVVSRELVPIIQSGCAKAIAEQQRKRYAQILETAGVGDGAFLKEVGDATVAALRRRGVATGAQLSTDEPRLRTTIKMAEGKAYASTVNITTWVLFQLGLDGRIMRGRPRGSWISSQYEWSPTDIWLPGGIEDMPPASARTELVRRWLAAFGPGTVADLRWWTGWTAAHVKAALTALDAVEVDLDGESGVVLPGDVEPTKKPASWIALLPALDPTAMGWSQRTWYVGEHRGSLFDRSGNIGPTIWLDGRIVGGWAQRADGEVVYRLLEDVGTAAKAAVEAEAARVSEWTGPVRVTPRFRTPLERELTA